MADDEDIRFADIPTSTLVNELAKREAVKLFDLPNRDHHYTIHITGKHGGLLNGYGNPGPVRILVVTA